MTKKVSKHIIFIMFIIILMLLSSCRKEKKEEVLGIPSPALSMVAEVTPSPKPSPTSVITPVITMSEEPSFSPTPTTSNVETVSPVSSIVPTASPPVSAIKIVIEDYVGKNIKEIKITGITVTPFYSVSQTIGKDIIISQNILPGTTVEEGQVIKLEVSLGKPEISYGYELTTNIIPREYSYKTYYFSINKFDNNVFLRSVSGIVVKNQLIIYGCESMFFDNNDMIYFRKLANGYLYSYSLAKKQETLLIGEKVNYYYYTNGKIYYSTEGKVVEYTINSKSSKTMADRKAKYFQIYNDKVYYIESTDGNANIMEADIYSMKIREITTTKVNSFIINKNHVYYYKSSVLFYIDLNDMQEYQATSEQIGELNFK